MISIFCEHILENGKICGAIPKFIIIEKQIDGQTFKESKWKPKIFLLPKGIITKPFWVKKIPTYICENHEKLYSIYPKIKSFEEWILQFGNFPNSS